MSAHPGRAAFGQYVWWWPAKSPSESGPCFASPRTSGRFPPLPSARAVSGSSAGDCRYRRSAHRVRLTETVDLSDQKSVQPRAVALARSGDAPLAYSALCRRLQDVDEASVSWRWRHTCGIAGPLSSFPSVTEPTCLPFAPNASPAARHGPSFASTTSCRSIYE